MASSRDRETRRPSAAAFNATENRNETRRPSAAAAESQREQTDVLLRDLGASKGVIEAVRARIDDVDVQSVVSRLRTFAEANPRVVLGALSALIAGGAAVAGRAVKKKMKSKATVKPKARTSSKRTLIEPHPGDKRYIRRDAKGRITESDDVGRSLSADRRRKAKTRSKSGSGDKGDR